MYICEYICVCMCVYRLRFVSFQWNNVLANGRRRDQTELLTRISGQAPNKCCVIAYTVG